MPRLSFGAMVLKMTAKVNCAEPGEVCVEAPPFHIWCCGVHELVCTDKREAAERMSLGFIVCDDIDCDWCADTAEE